eukprot:scaffold75360_cov16-Tisochrysis_lutea.AAC.2
MSIIKGLRDLPPLKLREWSDASCALPPFMVPPCARGLRSRDSLQGQVKQIMNLPLGDGCLALDGMAIQFI